MFDYRAILSRLVRIITGYIAACFASGACVLGGATILVIVQQSLSGTGEVSPLTHSVFALIFLSLMLMALGTLPALALGLIAEIFKIRHWIYYVLSGIIICFVMWRGLPFQASGDFQFFLLAGALGGGVYWRIAGRHAGKWREREPEMEEARRHIPPLAPRENFPGLTIDHEPPGNQRSG